jgi:Flp pilus assembly protein TadG
MLVILVPVIFGFMGFAIDLGRLYMIRQELKTAANAMALAAAARLNGTDAAADAAATAAEVASAESGGLQNKFDFGGVAVGESEGVATSTVDGPEFFDTVAAATGGGEGAGDGTVRHARVSITAEAPLLFWRFLAQGIEGRTQVRVQAVAGISAPLCTACGIEAIAVAALDPEDTTEFGFTQGTRYTLGYVCNGPNQPQPLAGTTQRVPYLLINRLNEEAQILTGEDTQAFRIGAGGLPASTNEAVSCLRIDAVEAVWASALPLACPLPGQQGQVPAQVRSLLCGMATRFETGVFAGCETIAESDAAAAAFVADTDTTDLDDYAAYTGSGRRVITVAIVDALGDPQAMTVLGFRQFLVEPLANNTNLSPTDPNGRFVVLYIGNRMPLKQGRFSGCSAVSGPGKVVLHQ